jgi:hypothetical protein
LVPDLDANLAVHIVLEAIVEAASAAQADDRKLTRRTLWEHFNDSTLEALAAAQVPDHLQRAITGSASGRGLRACCLIVGDARHFASLEATSKGWTSPNIADLTAHLGSSTDFVCYIAISPQGSSARRSRDAVLRQARFVYPDIRRPDSQDALVAREVAREMAQRCIAFERRGHDRASIAPFITKVRWLRLSTGQVLTAKALLTE